MGCRNPARGRVRRSPPPGGEKATRRGKTTTKPIDKSKGVKVAPYNPHVPNAPANARHEWTPSPRPRLPFPDAFFEQLPPARYPTIQATPSSRASAPSGFSPGGKVTSTSKRTPAAVHDERMSSISARGRRALGCLKSRERYTRAGNRGSRRTLGRSNSFWRVSGSSVRGSAG